MNAPTLPWDADYFAQREAYMVGLKRAVWQAYKAARRWKPTPARLVEVAKRQTRLIDYRDIYGDREKKPYDPLDVFSSKARRNPILWFLQVAGWCFHEGRVKLLMEHERHGNPKFDILHETMEGMK